MAGDHSSRRCADRPGNHLPVRGLDAVPPVTAALTSGIEPILNPVLAAIICGETIGPMSLAGGVLVVCSVLGYSLSQIKQPSVLG